MASTSATRANTQPEGRGFRWFMMFGQLLENIARGVHKFYLSTWRPNGPTAPAQHPLAGGRDAAMSYVARRPCGSRCVKEGTSMSADIGSVLAEQRAVVRLVMNACQAPDTPTPTGVESFVRA